MKKILKMIGNFEVRLKDEFSTPIFKAKGNPSKISEELDDFFKIKGLNNVRKPKQPKRK